MSERQEHRQRLNARIAYAAAIERWAKNQPPRIRFFAVRRWLREMPRKENFYAAEIEAAPTVDAVQVTRCKDCAHARKKNDYESAYLCYGVLICTSCEASEDGWLPVWPQHFCSYGHPWEEHDAETEE